MVGNRLDEVIVLRREVIALIASWAWVIQTIGLLAHFLYASRRLAANVVAVVLRVHRLHVLCNYFIFALLAVQERRIAVARRPTSQSGLLTTRIVITSL